jgi:hypothetical protein
VAPKLSRGLIRLGHQVVEFADRDVARASTLLPSRRLGVAGANRALLRLAQPMRPDLLLLGHADTIRTETIAELRRAMPAMRVLQWNVDPLFDADNVARLQAKLAVVDATLVSTAGEALAPLRQRGMRLGFLPNPVDFSIESGRADLARDLPYDLFFACGHPSRPPRMLGGREWHMEPFFARLQADVPALRPRLAGLCGQPHLGGDAYQQALSETAVGLNASKRNDYPLYTSDRIAHMAGNGQAILIDRATGYDRLFGPEEMGFFSSFEELVNLLRRLIADPDVRCAMAGAGRARYHALFNETLVARYVVDVAFDAHDPGAYVWPTLID